MSFLQHLEELRWHIIKSVVAIIAMAILAFIFKDIIFDQILLAPKNPDFFTNRMFAIFADKMNSDVLRINDKPFELINITMAGQFSTHIWISVISGIILAFPYIVYEFWKFFSPALYDKERRYARYAVLAISFLFFIGVLFGYYVIVPLSIHFLGSYQISATVQNTINLPSYFSTIASVTLAAGIVFELPVVVFFLSKIGIVTPQFLRTYRKHAIIVILILSAIITPPDIFSQILVTIPLVILYEVSIHISAAIQRNKEKELAS
ncbi:MAG: twin-arginine translocase subunit TatC [Bacteroidetes bacterium]|nr:twin-arginine translocase subunit TatC [Bacteroidota bacterium]